MFLAFHFPQNQFEGESVMRPSDVADTMDAMFFLRQAMFLWGPPGGGKSQLGQQCAKRLGVEFLDVRMFMHDPSDFKFPLPDLTKQTIKWVCSLFPADPAWRGIIMLEDFSQCPPMTQNVGSQITLDRRCGDYVLPAGAVVWACGNRMDDRAHAVRMGTHLLSRLCHIDLDTSFDDWMQYAIQQEFAAEVRAYMNYRPQNLHAFDPSSNPRSFPCPRSWEFISNVVKVPAGDPAYMPHRCRLEVFTGFIGESYAADFNAFLNVYLNLPDLDKIINNPKTADVPKEPGVCYALAGAIAEKARKADKKQLGNIMTYSMRLPDEYTILVGRDAGQANMAIFDTPEGEVWLKKYRHELFPERKKVS
jgi:hypothetical protein